MHIEPLLIQLHLFSIASDVHIATYLCCCCCWTPKQSSRKRVVGSASNLFFARGGNPKHVVRPSMTPFHSALLTPPPTPPSSPQQQQSFAYILDIGLVKVLYPLKDFIKLWLMFTSDNIWRLHLTDCKYICI